jgi:purine-binding chemotaxis protein CheW
MNFSASTFTETGRALQAADPGAAQVRSLLVFHLGERVYGLAIEQVVQIIAMVKLTPVPQAEQLVEGVANIHGKIVPVLSARRLLGLPLVEPQLYTPIILMKSDGRTFGLIVDEVADVVRLPASQIAGPEAFMPLEAENTGVLDGVVYHGDAVIMLLNPRCLLNPVTMRAFKREAGLQPAPGPAPIQVIIDQSLGVSPSTGNGDERPAEKPARSHARKTRQAEPQKPAEASENGKARKGRRKLDDTLAGQIAGLAADLPPTDGQIPPKPDNGEAE